jgi:hypothetical protein
VLNYFVYKNGKGNFWSALAKEHEHFYVGFDDEWPKEAGETLAPTQVNGGDTPHSWKLADLNHIRFVSHGANQAEFMLLTFEKTELCFWRVTGPVKPASKELHEAARKIHGGDLLYREYFVPSKDKTDPDGLRVLALPPFRVLPVKLAASVRRNGTYTSVDSLASYQYLIRGTCRPLWRASGPTGSEVPWDIEKHRQNQVPRCQRVGKEEPFGAFVRLYLNELLHRHAKLPAEADGARLGNHATDLTSARNIVMATLNPILVETAALAFVQDLGLTPDIGVGKSKDVVDVRARAAAPDGTRDRERAAEVWMRLKALEAPLPSLELSEVLRHNLVENGTLDIQCKAADRDAKVAGILYFGFKGEEATGPDLLLLNHIDALLASGSWPHLDRFLAMQARILRGEWSP